MAESATVLKTIERGALITPSKKKLKKKLQLKLQLKFFRNEKENDIFRGHLFVRDANSRTRSAETEHI